MIIKKIKNWITGNFLGYITVNHIEKSVTQQPFVDITVEDSHEYYGGRTRWFQFRSHNCDDPMSEQTALSKAERDKINSWYAPGLRSRLLPHSGEVLCNTRWTTMDLSGFLLNADGKGLRPWKVISFPALLTPEASELMRQPNDPPELYAPGTSFWPELWPTELFVEKKADLTLPPTHWAALYQQNPVEEEGNIIKKSDFKYWPHSEPPSNIEKIIISYDTAFSTKTTADFSAIQVWGVFKRKETGFDGREYYNGHMILLESHKGRWEFPELCEKLGELDEFYQPDFHVIEKKASGQSLLQEARRRGFPVFEFNPDTDKVSRVYAATPTLRSGRVWVPKDKQWVEELITEACAFPRAANDDQVDAMVQAILWLRQQWAVINSTDSYADYDEDEEQMKSRKKTYWSTLQDSM